jgi:hypothetical protein
VTDVPDRRSDVLRETNEALLASSIALYAKQRWLAGGAAFLFGVPGGIAVFITANQIAAAAMLLAGAVFLLVAVQGTPVTKASAEGFELLPPRRVEESRKTIEETKGPKEAFYFVEGAVTAKPEIRKYKSIAHGLAASYEKWVIGELNQVVDKLGLKLLGEPPISDSRADAIIVKSGEVVAAVEVKYLPDGFISREHVERTISGVRSPKVLIISNVPFSKDAYNFSSDPPKRDRSIYLLRWTPDDDEKQLQMAIVHALSSLLRNRCRDRA